MQQLGKRNHFQHDRGSTTPDSSDLAGCRGLTTLPSETDMRVEHKPFGANEQATWPDRKFDPWLFGQPSMPICMRLCWSASAVITSEVWRRVSQQKDLVKAVRRNDCPLCRNGDAARGRRSSCQGMRTTCAF